ncbi:MAG TPA: DegT/DnrJ/EryC1/StrS family aminotransferase [Solirubrobacteraceae bacterium]|jgi:dTDP-3-amino-3,4,6-trideoxy-alpha-D-glucose transaminase|nr:DegT/DnrJ/EryC1/StrS family aminotransferase [Solirubrobacteraceae bacterium]
MTVMDHGDPELFEELLEAVRSVAATGAFTGGAAVEAFEADYARWCEAPFAVGVSSGTEALVLALRALGIGSGDEVVVPANSFIATAEAVSLAGARPRFADVDRETQLMTASTLAPVLGKGVRCVIPVHLFGRTAEMGPIMELARGEGLAVIEDTSQAHGARYRGQRVGTIADAGTFSFYPAKNLGAWGDAGAVVTASECLYDQVRLMRSHGESPRYHHRVVGSTGRLDAIQAAVLQLKLARLEEWNVARRRVAAGLRDALAEVEEIALPAPVPADCDHVYHQFVIRTSQRDALREQLVERGIATGIHYPIPIHLSEAYADLAMGSDVAPNATALATEILSLPIFPAMTDDQIAAVGDAVRAGVR